MMHVGVIMALFHVVLGAVVFHRVSVVLGVVVSICHCRVVVLMVHMLMIHRAFFVFLLWSMA